MTMVDPADEELADIKSFDGTRLAARKLGDGPGTPLLICNAVGTSTSVWSRIVVELLDARPVIAWDLRGLNYSDLPHSDRIDPEAHVEDAIAVADHFDLEEVAVAGWSTGTRIALGFAAAYPERTRSLTLVCGGYGYPLRRLRFLELSSLLPVGAGITKYLAGFLETPLRNLTRRPEFPGLIRQSGQIAASADIGALVEMFHEVADCDLRQLLATYEAIAGDAEPALLDLVEARALLFAGSRDQITSMRMMEKMEQRIPGAELIVYEGATHYLPFEFPTQLAGDLSRFLAETEPLGS